MNLFFIFNGEIYYLSKFASLYSDDCMFSVMNMSLSVILKCVGSLYDFSLRIAWYIFLALFLVAELNPGSSRWPYLSSELNTQVIFSHRPVYGTES